jgi:hypothetical protein
MPSEAGFVSLFYNHIDERPVLRIYRSDGPSLRFYLTISQIKDLVTDGVNVLASMSLEAQDQSTSNVAGNIEGAPHANGR